MRIFFRHNYVKINIQLTILRHFLKIFSMIHMPPKPIASACWLRHCLILCKKLTFQVKIYSQTQVSCSIFSKFSRENIYAPKPLAINHRAALSLFHR